MTVLVCAPRFFSIPEAASDGDEERQITVDPPCSTFSDRPRLSRCVGAFDDPSPFRLVEEIFIDKKPAGYALSGNHPRLTEAETFAKFAARRG